MEIKKDDLRTFSIMAKPVGAACNLRCAYCYYLDKGMANHARVAMPDDVLDAYIRQNLEAHGKDAEIEFAWHGGEPTLAPLSFYRKAVTLQKTYGAGRKIFNTLQTNATLLDDEWCSFFAENNFLLGVSIDGPKEFHNIYRGSCFDKVMHGVALLKKHKVQFNTLTTINASNWEHPREVYGFLRELTDFMQFLPVVEARPAAYEVEKNRRFAAPPGIYSRPLKHPVFDFSVPQEGYGFFLKGVLTEWKKQDYGKKHIGIFEATLGNMQKRPAGVCVHEALCGNCAVVEINGDVYACDRYAYGEYKIGNILETPLKELMEHNRRFGMHKVNGLPDECFACKFVKLCFGGCPKDRILWTTGGQAGKNYLCESYQMFFEAFSDVF